MRFTSLAFLIFTTSFLLSGCFLGLGVERITPPPKGIFDAGFDTTDTNVFLYLISVIGVAAGIALVIWTPFKMIGAFVATMFGLIVALISIFAVLIKLMPWIIGGACVLAIIVGVVFGRKYYVAFAELAHLGKEEMSPEAKKIVEEVKSSALGKVISLKKERG